MIEIGPNLTLTIEVACASIVASIFFWCVFHDND